MGAASGRFVAGFLQFQWEPRREPAANPQHENILFEKETKGVPGVCKINNVGAPRAGIQIFMTSDVEASIYRKHLKK